MLRQAIKQSPRLRRAIYDPLQKARYFVDPKFRRYWRERIEDVLACPDIDSVPRVRGAGSVVGDVQVMHNGVRIRRDSYYSYPNTRMLRLSRGVHEPQEEKAFAAVLPFIPRGGTMIELGAYWAFYSLWFSQSVPEARNILVEPDAINLLSGQDNFALNRRHGTFIQAEVGSISTNTSTCVDDIVVKHDIKSVDMLHSDIQGYEHDMLRGATKTFDKGAVKFAFISTHSNRVHQECLDFLTRRNFVIMCAATLDETYSVDGLIAARSPTTTGPDTIAISKRKCR